MSLMMFDVPIRPERAEAPSPGHRPGDYWQIRKRPVRAKALNMRSFCPYRASLLITCLPRALPWARSFCPFRAYGASFIFIIGVNRLTVNSPFLHGCSRNYEFSTISSASSSSSATSAVRLALSLAERSCCLKTRQVARK